MEHISSRIWCAHVYPSNLNSWWISEVNIIIIWERQQPELDNFILTTPMTEGSHPLYNARGPSSRRTVARAWAIPLYWLGELPDCKIKHRRWTLCYKLVWTWFCMDPLASLNSNKSLILCGSIPGLLDVLVPGP